MIYKVAMFAKAEIEDFKGQIYSLCKDQQGCRFFQRKLDETHSADPIFNEIHSHVAELMQDPFGNYLCQKLLEYCTDEQRAVIIKNVCPHLLSICLNSHGTRAVQKLCETVAQSPLVGSFIFAVVMNYL